MIPEETVAISSTLPIEAVYASGRAVMDLNNRFIASADPAAYLASAARAGLPRTFCAWTRGVFAAALDSGCARIVLVGGGDCTHARVMGERLAALGLPVSHFSFPFTPDRAFLKRETEDLCARLGTTLPAAERTHRAFAPIRAALRELDELTFDGGRVGGFENHVRLIAGSDLAGDPARFAAELDAFLRAARRRRRAAGRTVRLGVIGIPPVFPDLHSLLEEGGAAVVYNELSYEFSMAEPAKNLLDQYMNYTYPYALDLRLERIRREAARRNLDGLVHYSQSFCFHRTEHEFFAERLGLPVVLVEGHDPGPVDPRTRTRLHAFLESFRPARRGAGRKRTLAGLDLGSRNVKLVVESADGARAAVSRPTPAFYRAFLAAGSGAFDRAFLRSVFPELPADARLAVTGYGRDRAEWPGIARITELSAHALGAREALGLDDFTLVDIGGQDTKVVTVERGRVTRFELNDRCAAGSGRFLENMAAILGLSVEELAQSSGEPEPLDATCATFGETELVGKILAGVPLARLAAGVVQAVFDRLSPVVARLARGPVALSGGGARCARLVDLFRERFGDARRVPDPEFNGARGCVRHLCGGRAEALPAARARR